MKVEEIVKKVRELVGEKIVCEYDHSGEVKSIVRELERWLKDEGVLDWRERVMRKLKIVRDEKMRVRMTVSQGMLYDEGVEETVSGCRYLVTELMKDVEVM